mgnify:CR=1 FL=1
MTTISVKFAHKKILCYTDLFDILFISIENEMDRN